MILDTTFYGDKEHMSLLLNCVLQGGFKLTTG